MDTSRLKELLDFLFEEKMLFEGSFCKNLLGNDRFENEAFVQGMNNFDDLRKLVQDKIDELGGICEIR